MEAVEYNNKKVNLSLCFKTLTSPNSEISDKKNQFVILSFPLGSQSRVYTPHLWLFFLRIVKLAIVELNRVIKSELGDINLHLREKKSELLC